VAGLDHFELPMWADAFFTSCVGYSPATVQILGGSKTEEASCQSLA